MWKDYEKACKLLPEFEEQLSGCPFCGGEAEIKPRLNPISRKGKRSVTVRCKKCRIERTDAVLKQSSVWLLEKAVEQWNDRDI